jgi:hypothetical protein
VIQQDHFVVWPCIGVTGPGASELGNTRIGINSFVVWPEAKLALEGCPLPGQPNCFTGGQGNAAGQGDKAGAAVVEPPTADVNGRSRYVDQPHGFVGVARFVAVVQHGVYEHALPPALELGAKVAQRMSKGNTAVASKYTTRFVITTSSTGDGEAFLPLL